MELRHLRYFVAVGSQGNYRKAAEALHVSQPALSKQISDLEEELGVALLERHSRGARLTSGGRAFLEEAQEILARVERAASKTRDAQRGDTDVLRIGQISFLASSFLPRALASFRRKYPHVDVKIGEMHPLAQFESLRQGRIDVGITASLSRDLPRVFAHRFLFRTKMGIVAAHDHPLLKKTSVSLSDLRDETLLCYTEQKQASGHRERIRSVFSQSGFRCPRIKLVEDYESLVVLLAGGHGVTIAPPFAEALAARGIAARPFIEEVELLFLEIRAVWLESRTAPLLRPFVDLLDRHSLPLRGDS
ncbi:LysR family transcriptional regulator [Opitutaceae bacterium EW11]|nr:LysR family transcriptional regulator [Opitutaceae bacterium EW11]